MCFKLKKNLKMQPTNKENYRLGFTVLDSLGDTGSFCRLYVLNKLLTCDKTHAFLRNIHFARVLPKSILVGTISASVACVQFTGPSNMKITSPKIYFHGFVCKIKWRIVYSCQLIIFQKKKKKIIRRHMSDAFLYRIFLL